MIILLALVALAGCATEQKKTTIFIAGDSTAQTYKTSATLMRGWGQVLADYIDTTAYSVANHAKAGRSTKSFIAEARWDSIMNNVEAGDMVLIQFGHNDQSPKPERHTTRDEYIANLARMVNDTRAKGATPVLLTSIVMHTFEGDSSEVLVDNLLLERPALTRRVARDMGVKLIDCNTFLRDTVLLTGNEASKAFYMYIPAGVDSTYKDGRVDDTHLREAGARIVAKYIAGEL